MVARRGLPVTDVCPCPDAHNPWLTMPRRLEPPFYFTNLTIENVRCFGERQKLKLVHDDGRPARWTLIVGENGVGKTTLLECLARMRPNFNPPPDDDDGPPPNPVEPEFAAEDDNLKLLELVRSGSDTPVQLEAHLSVGRALATQEGRRPEEISTSLSITRTAGQITNVTSGGEPSCVDFTSDVETPLVMAYGAGRRPWISNVDKDMPTDPIASLFRVEAALHDAEELLCRLDHGSSKKYPRAMEMLAGLREILSAILPDVQDPQDINILGPAGVPGVPLDETGIHVKTPYGTVPLSQLSFGYRTVFAWTVDIAWWLLQRNPRSSNPFHEPAIVIVDEIDLHLHPRWQREIRGHLTEHFPRVQFIATAHSPLMAQSSLDANVAVVRQSGDHTEILNDPVVVKSWRIDQLVTSELFGLASARSPELEKQEARRSELLEKPELSRDEHAELEELNRMALEMPTGSREDERAMEIIRRAAAQLDSNEKTS